jgi:hypothetical protein
MRTVFNSTTELANIWATQKQSHGKANSVFFSHSSAYSYGYHYQAGVLLTLKGQKVCILNATRYSVTTRKHVYKFSMAAQGQGFKCFYIPFGKEFDQNKICIYLNDLINQAKGLLRKQFNARSTTYNFDRAEYLIYQIIDLARLFDEGELSTNDFPHYTELKAKIYGI